MSDNEKPLVFICYAREDNDNKNEHNALKRRYIAMLVKKLENYSDKITVFYDKVMKPGIDWDENVMQKLNDAKVVIVFLSSNFYGNDKYCRKIEAPIILYRQKNENINVFPIVINDINVIKSTEIEMLSYDDVKNKRLHKTVETKTFGSLCWTDYKMPLNDETDNDLDKIFSRISAEISNLAKPSEINNSESRHSSDNAPNKHLYDGFGKYGSKIRKVIHYSISKTLESNKEVADRLIESFGKDDINSLVNFLTEIGCGGKERCVKNFLELKNIAIKGKNIKSKNCFDTVFAIVKQLLFTILFPEQINALIKNKKLTEDSLEPAIVNIQTSTMLQIFHALNKKTEPRFEWIKKEQMVNGKSEVVYEIISKGELQLTDDAITSENHTDNVLRRLGSIFNICEKNKDDIESELYKLNLDHSQPDYYLKGNEKDVKIVSEINIQNLKKYICSESESEEKLCVLSGSDINAILRDYFTAS